MNSVDYNVQKFPWYSPHLIIRSINKLTKIYGNNIEDKGEFKLAREMFDAAVALLGAYELDSSNKYFMQANAQSSSPDVMSAKQAEQLNEPILLELNQIEIVTMNEYSDTDDVVEFLKRTKLSSKKSYSEKTLIVLVINKKIQINRREIADSLEKINPKPTIYILGKLAGDNDKWTIFSPWPLLTKFVIYSLSDTMKKYQLPECVSLHRRIQHKVSYSDPTTVTTTIQQLFNIKEDAVEKYRKV